MQIRKLPVRGFASNSWLVFDEESRMAAVIDPSADAEVVLRLLREGNLTLSMILLTHGHFDHIFAADTLRASTDAPLMIHEKDAPMLTDATLNASALFFGEGNVYKPADRLLHGGDALSLGNNIITVRHTPGHTEGSVCFVLPGRIFTGDTLFEGSIGRTDLPGGDERALNESLRRIAAMRGEYTLYAGHGNVTTLEHERKNNPYLSNI